MSAANLSALQQRAKTQKSITAVIRAMQDETGRGPRPYENDLLSTVHFILDY